MNDGIAVGEERVCWGERKLSSRGGEVFVGMKKVEIVVRRKFVGAEEGIVVGKRESLQR